MKWTLFTGTWRLTNEEVESDVRAAVREIFASEGGVLTGGATGVDFFAMDEALRLDPAASRLKVIIPAGFEHYIQDVYQNWCIPPVTKETADLLAALLRKIKSANPDAIVEMPYETITQEHYDLRDVEEVKASHDVCAFQVNDSTGTQHTVDQAKLAGLPIVLHKKYEIKE